MKQRCFKVGFQEPLVVSGCLVTMHRAFDDQVFNVRLNVQPDERLVSAWPFPPPFFKLPNLPATS